MKLAFFSSIVPDGNPTTGYEIANEAIVDGLRELGHEVSVFGFKLPRQRPIRGPDTHVLSDQNLENVFAGPAKKLEWFVRALWSGLPIAAGKLTAVTARALMEKVREQGPFDGYILNSYQMAGTFPELQTKPYIYVAHNVEYRSALENEISASSTIERYLYRRDARLLKSLEAKLCDQAQFVWTFSADDLEVHGVKDGDGCVLPLVTPCLPAKKSDVVKNYDIGLIGTWSWQPNFVGLKWFLDEIVPLLTDSLTVAVAGSVPDGLQVSQKNVQLLGRVESANEFLQSVRVVPLVSRGGTGVQLKTIEALQAGYACVATSSSLRGIATLPENCLRADDAASFAAAVEALVERHRAGQLVDVDGGAFYRDQRQKMLDGLVNGTLKLT